MGLAWGVGQGINSSCNAIALGRLLTQLKAVSVSFRWAFLVCDFAALESITHTGDNTIDMKGNLFSIF